MKIELIENTEFGFYNIKFGSKPDYEHDADMLNELKANGWAWSRHNGVWYPRTTEAKAKANTFAAEFAKKYNEPVKSFGQELFERTQRIDQWKNEHLLHEQNNEPVPVQEEAKPVELNDNQKKVYELLKATNNFSENQILEMVSKIDTAYQTENFDIPELSWEEIKSFIHADDSFDLAKDLRDLYNPNISESYNKINVVYNYLHDLMDFDVLGENQYERSADEEYHTMRESIRHDILQPVCENIVMGRYSDFFDMQEDFISRREEKIADISKSYMENPAIKEQYIGMKRAELLKIAPEILKGREFNSWILNVDNDGHFLFYESKGYLKSEFLNEDKYNTVKDFLSKVEELDLLEESSKQLKEEYTKMHSLLEKPPVQIQEELIAKEVEEELANADEEIDTSVSEYNELGIDARTGEPWNGEESEDVSEPETQEEESTELTQADLDNATKVIPENQYQFMLENAAGEEAEYFKQKLKNMATICADLQKHSNKENVNKDGSHPCKLHYFLGNCDWYISELDNDGIGFGYCILNGDLYSSEWGSVNVCGDSTYEQPLTKMAINVPIRINGSEFHRSVSPELDLHLDEDTTIERELYKLDNEYFADYKKYAEKDEKILAKSSEVSINIIEETNQELEVENGSKTDIGYERRAGISSGSNLNQGLEEPGAEADRGSDTGRGQRVLHSEREENGSLENSEGIPELHTVGRKSEISDLHIEEGLSGNNEILHSERSFEAGDSDLQQTGLENGQISHRVRTVEPGDGTGVNPNENTSSEPLHGNEEVIEKETPVYNINGTEYTQETIETLITEDIQNVLNTLSHVPVIEGVRLYQNPEQTGAINILLQYSSKNNDVKWSEDSLFNVLAQEELTFNGMPVDVNPITPEKSGTIEQYLEHFESLGVTNENEAIVKQAEMIDEQFDFAKLADDICQQSYEQSGAGFNYYIYFEEIAGLAGKDVAWVKENIEKIGEALEEHNDELLLDFNLKEALEEDSLDLNFCSVGEDANELFKKDDSGRWVRKTDKELAYEKAVDDQSPKWNELESAFYALETFRGNFEEIKREVFEQYLDKGIHFNETQIYFNETQWQEETVYRLLEENINFGALAETAEELDAPNHSQRMEQRSAVLENISAKIVSGKIKAADYQKYYEEKYPELFNSEIKVKPYDFFINDVANLDLGIGAEIDPIIGLSAEKAALKYAELKDKGLSPYIGINIPGDFIFDDEEGLGAAIFTETNGHPSFYMGDNFVKELKKNDEHARTVIAAYKELYAMTDKYILGVQRPDFVFVKEKELFGNQETHILTKNITKENEVEAHADWIEVYNTSLKWEEYLLLTEKRIKIYGEKELKKLSREYARDFANEFITAYKQKNEDRLLRLNNGYGYNGDLFDDERDLLPNLFIKYFTNGENLSTDSVRNGIKEFCKNQNVEKSPINETNAKSENVEHEQVQTLKKLSKEQQQALDNIRFIMRNDTMMRVLEEVELNRIGGKYNSFAERLDHIADVIRNTNSESLVAVIANIDFSKYETNPASVEQKIFDLTNIFEFWERGLALNKELENSKEQTISKEPEQLTSKKDIKAIREQCREILQKPDSEITEADKAILAQYEGAGGIKEDNRTASGILNEFYTPNNLVEKVWQIVDAYAPDAKTVLEPSAGVGKFANNRPNNEFTMHELDETSARINKILHPEANVIQGAYQKQFFDAGERIHMPGQKEHYDVVIGNPPYGLYNDKYKGLGEGKEFDRYEEYFISKGLDALKDENSIMAFVVPSGFLNNASDKQKEIIASKGKLIDAYRLPVGTFPTTDVGTDIIIMTSWEKDRNEIDLKNQLVGVKAHAQLTNERLKKRQENYLNILSSGEWFKQHPEKILGEVKTRTNRFGKIEEYVAVHEGLTIQEELNKIDSFLKNQKNEWTVKEPEKSSSPSIQPQPAANKEQTVSQDIAQSTEVVEEELDGPTKRLYEDPDGIFKTKHQLTREEFAKFYTGANFTQEDYNIWGATDWKGNVDTSKLTEAELSYLISSDNYVKINEGVYTNAMLYATGNIYQKLDELEENKEYLSSESYEKAKAILTNAIPKVVPIENIKIDALSPLAQEFKVHREVTSSRWYMGRTELQTVELDIDLREDFINWATNCSSLDNFDENNQSINSRRSIYNYSSAKISREDIPEDISWTDIVNYIDRVPVPTHIDEKHDTKEVKNKKNLIAGNIKDARKNTCYELFNRYIQEGLPQEDKERLQSTWNKIYNATVHADYKKLPLFIDGMSTFKGEHPFMLYKQQVEGVSRLLSKGNGLLSYEVGVGKTAAGIVTTMGQLQTGRCKRPLIIVPNQVYKKWVKDFRELFPDVKINELYNLSEKYIDKHFDERTHSLLIEPDSVTIITDSALQKITFSDAVCSNELAEDFSYLLGVSDALHSGDDKEKATAYQKIQNEIGKASRVQIKKLPEGREERIQQSYIFFDECGFDNVVIDEAHRYKNLFTVPRPKRGEKAAREFEGLGTGKPSIRAEKVFGITTLIQRRNEDRNVFLLTATPFTNNPLEVYSMLSFMGRKELINRHIYDVRDFCTEFAQTKFEYAVKPSGEIEPKQVMKNFRGQKKLKNLVFEYIDAVSAKEAGIERPEGERHPIYLELSPLQQRIIKLEQDAIAVADNPYVTLKAMTTMRTCTLSPALLDPDDFVSVEDIVIPPKSQIVESSPKLSWVCNTVADLYKQKPECGQFIYMPQGKDCFDEVKNYLIKQGIPDDAIDYIHSTHNGSAEDKDKISARFNNKEDKLKILIGTATVAEGIDLNGNSIVEYNTMLGWNPTESIQVEGRIWRQGNEQGKVHIMYPLMENSIDALIYQKHDEKSSRINSVLSKTDDGKDAIDTDEINPETIKFELITDPEKKIKMIIDEKTVEKRKEIKVIENRLETIQELEEDRQNCKTLYDTNVAEKEKYKSLLKTAREELKADPNNWQKEARVTSNERAVDTCNKEIAKSRNRLNTISYNFNKFDIHEPEREVPIKLQELITKKAELEADITDIENSKDRLIAEEQKKLLEKKILSKPVEELRREWVEYVNKNTWYKKQNDKAKDRNETVQEPLEAVKDFKVPDVMIKNLDKAMAEMDFKVLHNYLNWGDRDIINDCHENDKAIVILRERYEKTKGVKLPEQFRKTTEYLVSVCDEKTLPEVCKFKSMEEAVAYACSSWHGEAYQRDGYVEYVTLDNFKKNRDVSALAKDLQKREGQSYHGHGSPNGFGYDCSPKGVKIEAFINKKREEFFVNWNQVAKIKAKQWNREYPAEFTIKDEPVRVEEKNLKNVEMVQQDLFDFDEVKVQTKTLDIRMQGYNSQFILSDQALSNYRGLPPFMKKSDNEWVIRCKGEDFAKPQEGIASYELVDISITKEQLQGMVKAHLFAQQQEISHKKFDDPEYKGKVICPKPEVSDMQKELLKSNDISDNDLKKVTKENFNELLCEGEKPVLKKKLPQPKQLKQGNNQKLLPDTTIEITEDTDFDYDY